MAKEERLLKKIGRLLSAYGVSDEEKAYFLQDLKDKKYDDPSDDEVETETPIEETVDEETEEEVVEETPAVEEEVGEEVVAEEEPEPMVEPEQPALEEQPVPEDESPLELEQKVAEQEKTITELVGRIKSLEDTVMKLGVVEETEEDNIGLSPMATPSGEVENDTFDFYTRKRVG